MLRRLLGLLPALLVAGLVLWAALYFVLAPDLPDTGELFADARQARVTVIAADGSIVAERGVDGRAYVPLGQISPYVEAAVLATEDRRFYSHFGLDLIGTGRALLANLSSGGVVAGGSTITQQLAKNLYLTPERSLTRKLRELVLALWLEARLTKEQILEVYLNRVYLGAGAYGVEAAARRYFAKSAAELDLAEAAMIAGLLKAPSRYAPTTDLDAAQARAATVLAGMVDAGVLSAEDAAAARAAPAEPARAGRGDFAGYYVDHVLDGLTEHLGKPADDWVVRTTLDPRLQQAAEAALRTHLSGAPGLQGAVVLLDDDGAIRAMVGGRDYRGLGQNRALAERQPGSAFKTFVYLAALEAGMEPDDVVVDEPVRIGEWSPRNWDGTHRGPVTLTEAFARSINTVAVKLGEKVGRKKVAQTARRLGVSADLERVASLALGSSEVTLLDLTGAYLPFAAQGMRRPSYAVERVSDAAAGTLYDIVRSEAPVVAARPLAGMRRMLRAVVDEGTGRAAALGAGRVAYGKTGTTSANRDAWFVGFTGPWIAGVWVGRDDARAMDGVSGANLPARIWHDLMQAVPAVAPSAPRPVAKPRRDEDEPLLSTRTAERGLAMFMEWFERTF
ncbi:MAG: PBP1A family penicillin-binding protein [Geminicoccaceae bacterium]|nr:PBP1A family penicillin-binding protein [Geminicoccaceae bacterium]